MSAISRRGISELLSTILVISIVVVIAGIVAPWALNLTNRQVNSTQASTDTQITCQSTIYDFDSAYGSHGVQWDFSGTGDYLRTKVTNTGTISLYGFSFQVYIDGVGYKFFQASDGLTPEDPLKPGQSVVLEAQITENLAGSLSEVRVLNGVCKAFSAAQEF
jgi:flagellin-like protein